MAKIALRAYNHEIESQIEGGQLDEAIAHCQHILKTYPMHIETYRLLGKTYLEGRRYVDATDIFQRVLQAVPDDFVAHVGMSIIRDDENKLDEAIWHMERAFEVQPSNPAIQGELRRLYGRRDGAEPPKIRLTRDALANMYTQGELFTQAITEIRSVLSDDPNRPDLQVMLARAYYRSGQKVEAAETAIQLLKKFPHCLDALRILVDVLPGTTRSDDTQVYRQRLLQLDPYAAYAAGSVFHSAQVPDASINLEKLEYEPSLIQAPQQEWAATLGVKLKEPAAEKPPEWLTAAVGTAEAASISDRAPAPAAKSDVPEWLREAGWQESTGAAQEGPLDFSGAQPAGTAEAEPIARAELPSWLQSMAPQEVANDTVESSQATTESASAGVDETMENLLAGLGRGEEIPAPAAEAEVPDWLSGMRPASGLEEPKAVVPPPSETGTPDWLGNMRPISDLEEPAPSALAAEAGKPDWLGGMTAVPGAEEPATAAPPVEESGEADWLSGMKSVPGFEEQASPVQPAVEPATPDWLGGQPVPGVEAPAPAAQPADESDLPDWLKGISSSTGFEEPTSAVSAQPAEEFPAWLEQDKPFVPEPPRPVTAPIKPATSPLTAKPAAVEPAAPTGPTGPSRPLSIEDDAMAWLESLALKQGARPEELLTRPEDRPMEAPASVQNLAGQASQPAFAPASGKTSAVPLPPTPASLEPAVPPGPTGPTKPLSIEDDAMAWLESLALRQGARSEELLTRPEDRPLEPPASVQNLAAQAAAESQPAPVEPEPEPVSPAEPFRPAADDVTSWLKELDKETNPPPLVEAAPAPSTDLPDWLKGLEQPAATRLEPVDVPDELPEWLRTPPTPALASDEAPVWAREETAPVEPPTPTMPEEWVPVEKLEQAPRTMVPSVPVAAHPEPAPVSAVEKTPPAPEPFTTLQSKPGTTGELAKIPAQDKEADTLMLAQNSLDDGKLNASMQIYARLIKKGRLLDEVIHDLREAIYRYPVDVIIWQTLGDAYMRANRLQDALDAYTKAEELLR
jgi:cytochrome c-type biogenesis protein CcmH/NrfG